MTEKKTIECEPYFHVISGQSFTCDKCLRHLCIDHVHKCGQCQQPSCYDCLVCPLWHRNNKTAVHQQCARKFIRKNDFFY